MRNISDKSCRENQNTFYVLPPKTVPFMWYSRKILYSQTSHRWQCDTAHALCMLDN